MILGIGAGVLLYRISLGRLSMRWLTKWIRCVRKRLKGAAKAVTIGLEKIHRNQETENEEEKKKTP